jgi:hypothetical protein
LPGEERGEERPSPKFSLEAIEERPSLRPRPSNPWPLSRPSREGRLPAHIREALRANQDPETIGEVGEVGVTTGGGGRRRTETGGTPAWASSLWAMTPENTDTKDQETTEQTEGT